MIHAETQCGLDSKVPKQKLELIEVQQINYFSKAFLDVAKQFFSQ